MILWLPLRFHHISTHASTHFMRNQKWILPPNYLVSGANILVSTHVSRHFNQEKLIGGSEHVLFSISYMGCHPSH